MSKRTFDTLDSCHESLFDIRRSTKETFIDGSVALLPYMQFEY